MKSIRFKLFIPLTLLCVTFVGFVLGIMKDDLHTTCQTTNATVVVVLVLFTLVGILINHFVIVPVIRISKRMLIVSSKSADLTDDLQVHAKDEVGKLADSFNQIQRRFRHVVIRIKANSTNLKENFGEIRGTLQELREESEISAKASGDMVDDKCNDDR